MQITRSSFEAEAKRLRPTLLRVATSIAGEAEAEDVAQDTLLKLWFLRDRLERYSCLDGVATVIARNLSLNILRSRRWEYGQTDLIADLPDDCTNEAADIAREIIPLISQLPDMEQAVLRLKHIDEMETAEIAALTGTSPGAVRTALSRARCRLRQLYFNSQES